MSGAAASATPPVAVLDALVLTDLARHLKRGEPLRILGNAGVALAATLAFFDSAPLPWLMGWLSVVLAHSAFNAWAAWRVWRRPTRSENAVRRMRTVCRVEAVNGLLWMAAELLFLPGSDYGHRGLLMVLLSGLGAGVMQSLCANLRALYLFFAPAVLGFALAGALSQGHYFLPAVTLLLVWVAVNLSFARMMHRTLVESLQNRHIAHALAADLAVQRDRAVELSQARSRFLAAASHDLRQPVHALSLLVGALHQGVSAEQSQKIIAHVGMAVDAMGTMFNALLDISKLDAELVHPEWQTADLSPLLARIAADQAALTTAKVLGFRSVCPVDTVLLVRTDPILLERVLRNLLSNAIRYTDQGMVEVRARRRGGRVEIAIADTGLGIPRERRSEIFQEFVQLHPSSAPAERGLGLGLSIVQRLSALLQLELRLRSRPGRGSVFTVLLPLADDRGAADASTAADVPADRPAAPGGLKAGDVVVVIDDSQEIQLAMSTLLSAWGYRVFAAASVSELMPQMMALTVAPRLLLCDFRLRERDDGIGAIAELREAFNDDVPALLVTGDTGPERLRQAMASGLPLLHKPVTQAQLRHAIALAVPADPGA